MRQPLWIALLGAAAGAALLWRPSPAHPQARRATENVSQFRLVVGLTDQEPKTWTGAVSVSGGELDGIAGWRFSQQDRAEAGGSFAFRTKMGPLEDQLLPGNPYGQTDWGDPRGRRLIPQGLVVWVRGGGAARVKFASEAGTFEFGGEEAPFGRTLRLLGGNATVDRLPVESMLSEHGPADDYPAITVARDGAPWVAWLSYQDGADMVLTRGGGQLHRLTGRGDHHAPAIAADGSGRVWVAWSQNDNGAWRIYARGFDAGNWSGATRLSEGPGSHIWPRLVSDGAGRLALVWQSLRDNQSVIVARRLENGRWGGEFQVSEGPGNCWAPAAAFVAGKLWVAWDSYTTGSYQVYARPEGGSVERITRGENFSVRPSLANAGGRPVVAWEESDALWGKDFAYLFDRRATPLYKNRRIRVAYRANDGWREAPAPVDSLPPNLRRFMQQPELAAGAEGELFLAFRCRTSTSTSRVDYWASGGRWETFLTRLDGNRWTPAIPMPSSVGRNGMRAALAASAGTAYVAWASDQRAWPAVRYRDLEVYSASVAPHGAPARLENGPALTAAPPAAANVHANESADTRRIRAYRVKLNGRQYRILRGDLHRHTELSGDGAGDGALDDLYRYALDAAAMDYAHVGDHQMGNDEEYNWWITQKSNDLYYMPRRFVPLYGYERSVWWPNGHRNVVWAERGKPVLRIGPAEAKGEENSGPLLYPYLQQTGGIATSHSSATEQGTDWRDNDPALEPMVEIYQGFESSYEHAGAPRSWKEGEAKVHQGERPAGYVWNAWAKGYKLGVQASSDHISTHSSYACILVEDFTRQGLLDAMRKRHTYAATDQIVLDYRIETPDAGAFLMGDILSTSARPKLLVKVLGTAPIRRIDVIKNNAYVHQASPDRKEAALEYLDNAIAPGESYYYVRVEQSDGQLAWSSPIWVRYAAKR